MKNSHLLLAALLCAWIVPAQAQRQLLCEPALECSVTCYQDGMENAARIFHRNNIDSLQIDLEAKVLKIELRAKPEKSTAYDYFVLGSEMSCSIKNMRGLHD